VEVSQRRPWNPVGQLHVALVSPYITNNNTFKYLGFVSKQNYKTHLPNRFHR
jgi:hypothetical protein